MTVQSRVIIGVRKTCTQGLLGLLKDTNKNFKSILNLHFQNSNPSYTTTHMHPHVSMVTHPVMQKGQGTSHIRGKGGERSMGNHLSNAISSIQMSLRENIKGSHLQKTNHYGLPEAN